ncbi:tail fiber domain-containing protein [Shinella sp. S4-D37]|uniref:tail fiber domain-containing protein n=1 Tax=Shinella sp. S4-D37 TaxID=3161999 RepID=UPI003466D377
MASTPKETTTKTEPWDGAKPYILKYLDQADKLYDEGKPEYYQGQTYADQSKATLDAQKLTEKTARQGTDLFGNAQNVANGVMTGSAYSGQSGKTLGQGQAWVNPALSMQQTQAQNLSGSNNPAMSMLQQTANGDFLNSNPYLDQAISNANAPLIQQFKTQIAPGIDSKAALAGRTGSGAASFLRNDAESTLANAMSKNASDIAYQNYGNERTNQLNAQNSIGNFYNTDVGNQISANQAIAGTAAQQQGLRMDAANSQFQNENAQANTQLQAAGMSDYLRGLDYYDADKLAGVGAQKDAWNNMVKQADIAQWDYQQNQPLNNIANMINLANGGGYNNQTTPVYSNSGAQVLGGLSSILGLFMSDIRSKRILSHVGETPNGIPMYQFVYREDPEQRIYIGPIAQEMQEIKPDSVVEIDGTLFVDPRAFEEAPTWH